MNLIQQAEHLKMLPDQTIAQMQQSPGQTPPYLIIAEMQRRETMRKAYQASNAQNPMGQPSVNQQITQRFQQSAPMQSQGQQGYAEGGIVSYYPGAIGVEMPEGGLNGMALNPTDIDQMYGASPGIGDALKTLQGARKPSNRSAIAEALAAQEAQYRNKKTKLGDVLMNLGLSMAASRRPDFLGALAEGGIGALTGYTQDRDRNLSLADKYAAQRMAVMENEQRSEDSLLEQAAGLNRSQIAERNNAIATLEASKRAMHNAQSTAEWHKANNEAQKAIAVINANRATEVELMKEKAADKRAGEDRVSREKIAGINAASRAANRRQGRQAQSLEDKALKATERAIEQTFKQQMLKEMETNPGVDPITLRDTVYKRIVSIWPEDVVLKVIGAAPKKELNMEDPAVGRAAGAGIGDRFKAPVREIDLTGAGKTPPFVGPRPQQKSALASAWEWMNKPQYKLGY